MSFFIRQWQRFFLLLSIATTTCAWAQFRPADLTDFSLYGRSIFPHFAASDEASSAETSPTDLPDFSLHRRSIFPHLAPEDGDSSVGSSPDSPDSNGEARVIASRPRRNREGSGNSFQWAPAFSQYFLEISVQHGWRFAHEAGTRDATGYGPWFHDWVDSIGETRGWDDGDGWHASYVGHPLNGGIYGFIEQQNDPRYRKVMWGDGRIYWISRLRAMAFAAVASTQWTLGPLSENSLGNTNLHSSPGFIDIVQTPTLGVMEMMGEDLLDRYVVIPLENHTANPWLILATRSLCNPARSFANLMAFRHGWTRDDRPGIFGANHTLRKDLVGEYKHGQISAPFGPHSSDERAIMNEAVEPASRPVEAPVELHAYFISENFLNGHNCFGGGGQGAARINAGWQLVSEVNGCMMVGTPKFESADSVTFATGPRWTPRASHRFSPYLQTLVGGRRVTYEVMNPYLRDTLLADWDDGKGTLPHYPKRSAYEDEYQALGLNLTAGGGFDAAFGRAFAWRIFELNYSHSWLPPVHSIDTSNGIQLRTGLVLRIGNW